MIIAVTYDNGNVFQHFGRTEQFKLYEAEDGKILSHKEGALRGIATRHGDPDDYWVNAGTNYTMDGFRMDVKEYMEQGERDTEKDAPISQIIGKYKGSQI